MDDEELTTGELLEQWRDATRAAELAERLANLAKLSVDRSDRDAAGAQEIAKIAQRAAKHAERTARIAQDAADRARAFATENREGYLAEADAAVASTRDEEVTARGRFHAAERAVRERQETGLSEL